MVKLTFLEVHLDGSEFTANAPFSSTGDESEEADIEVGEVGDEDGDESGGKPWVAALVGLLFLAVVAAVARKKLGGGDETVPELQDRE